MKFDTPSWLKINVEIGANCNRNCVWCMRSGRIGLVRQDAEGKNILSVMPDEQVRRILSEAHSLGYRGRVRLNFYSEPTLHPRVVEYGRLARQLGMHCELITNGDKIMASPSFAREVRDTFPYVQFTSYDAASIEEHNDYSRRVRELIPQARTEPITSMAALFGSRAHELLASPPACRQARCNRIPRHFIITWEGKQAACCYDISAGVLQDAPNVFDVSLMEAWNCSARRSAHALLQQPGGRLKQSPVCAACNVPHVDGQMPRPLGLPLINELRRRIEAGE